MATEMELSTHAVGDTPTLSKKDFEGTPTPGEPILDHEGNVIKDLSKDSSYKSKTKDKYGQVSPIPRLAKVASFDRPIPTAGGWAIDNLKDFPQKDLVIPPECYLYDEDRPWVLGKLNPEALGVAEPAEPVPLSQKTLDYLDALDEAYFAEMRELRKQAEARNEAEELAAAKGSDSANKETVDTVETPKTTQNTKKPKSRNVSVSPAKGTRRPSTGRSSTSPATKRTERPLTGMPKTQNPKSPGRGASPQAKIVTSSGPKKFMNAKVDLEIVEKKN